jgi:hypothetical protein
MPKIKSTVGSRLRSFMSEFGADIFLRMVWSAADLGGGRYGAHALGAYHRGAQISNFKLIIFITF